MIADRISNSKDRACWFIAMEVGVSSIPVSEVFLPDFCLYLCSNFSALFSSIAKNMLTLARPTQGSHSAKMSIPFERQQQDSRSFSHTY